jgi:hypothetical protein
VSLCGVFVPQKGLGMILELPFMVQRKAFFPSFPNFSAENTSFFCSLWKKGVSSRRIKEIFWRKLTTRNKAKSRRRAVAFWAAFSNGHSGPLWQC